MKSNIKYFIVVILIIAAIKLNAQDSRNFIVHKTIDTTANSNQKKYTEVVFYFYDKDSKKQIKFIAININDVKILADLTTGEVKVYLSKKRYKFSVHFVSWANNKTVKLKIDPMYNYLIDVYLERSNEFLE